MDHSNSGRDRLKYREEQKSPRGRGLNNSSRDDNSSKHSKGLNSLSYTSNDDPDLNENYKIKLNFSSPISKKDIEKLEEMNPKHVDFRMLVELLPPQFQEEYLDKILSFLKGGSKELCFPNITPFKESFLVKLVNDRMNLRCDSFNKTCQSICRDILRVLDSNRHAFKWICAYECGIEKKDVLVYQKEFINNKKPDSNGDNLFKIPQSISSLKCSSQNLDNSDEDDVRYCSGRDSSVSHQDMVPSKLTRKQRNYKNMFDSLTLAFTVSSLQMVVDFMQDDTRTQLEFADVTADEARYLKSMNIFPMKAHLSRLLHPECQVLVIQLKMCLEEKALWILEGRMAGRHKLRTVTMYTKSKPPKTKSKSKKRAEATEKKRQIQEDCRSNWRQHMEGRERVRREEATSDGYDPSALLKKALTGSNDGESVVDSTEKSNGARRQEDKHTSNDRNGGSNRYNTQAPISWQPASTDPLDPGTPPDPGQGSVPSGPGSVQRPKRLSKLAEALSVPVEIDVAVRMMRRMGWTGGALGVRGEGIVEPIMPAIDTVQGRGLGHLPGSGSGSGGGSGSGSGARGRRDRKPRHFRLEVLEALVQLVKDTSKTSTELSFNRTISRSEKKFVHSTVTSLNARCSFTFSRADEQTLLASLQDALRCEPHCSFTDSYTDKTLTLTKGRTKKPGKRVLPKPVQLPLDVPQTTESEVLSDVFIYQTDIQRQIELLKVELGRRRGSKSTRAYKVTFLREILDFLQSDDTARRVTLKESLLTKSQIKYIDLVVKQAILKTKHNFSTTQENRLFADIKDNLNCRLVVSYDTEFTYFVMRKYYIKTENENNKITIDNSQKPNKMAEKQQNDIDEAILLSDADSIISLDWDNILSSDEDLRLWKASEDLGMWKDDVEKFEINNDINAGKLETENEVVVKDGGNENITDDSGVSNIEFVTSEIEVEIGNVSLNCDSDADVCLLSVSNEDDAKSSKVIEDNLDVKSESGSMMSDIIKGLERAVNAEASMDVENNTQDSVTAKSNVVEVEEKSNNDSEVIKDDNKAKDIEVNNAEGTNNVLNDYEKEKINDDVVYEKVPSGINGGYYEMPSPGSGKRSRSMSQNSDICENKRAKIGSTLKEIFVVISNNSKVNIDRQLAAKIQEALLKTIEKSKELPYLKCHGIIDGVLHYECGNTNSLAVLKDCIQKVCVEDVNLTVFESTKEAVNEKKNRIKMAVKTNSFLVEDPKNIFKRIELYNTSIHTDNWVILDEAKNDVFVIEIDNHSFQCISDLNYCLYAGIDRVEFSRIFT